MNDKDKIRILIVDDSTVVTYLLKTIFNAQHDMEVVGCAQDGVEAVRLAQELKPSMITMDIRMPNMDGFEATREIMSSSNPVPIVVISSSVDSIELNIAFNALDAGALTIIEKPQDVVHAGFQEVEEQLIHMVRALSEVKVITRRKAKKKPNDSQKMGYLGNKSSRQYELLALGASTGGPEALRYIFERLHADFPAPIVVVQHMAKNFLPGLVAWLQQNSALNFQIAENRSVLQAGTVYFAPDNYHLHVALVKEKLYSTLVDSSVTDAFKPSVTELFSSIARSLPGKAMAGLMTGMGRDGASGLLEMYKQDCGTFIQDKESSVVYGMPAAALKEQATKEVIALEDIPSYLIRNM
jgi:two-component system, chemotaxis family, protein-glutamate methylesterase/glutaminase